MTALKLIQFSGEIPRLLPRLLPESSAQHAENVRLDNGGLSPIRQAKLVDSVEGIPEGEIKTIFRYGDDWLAWNKVVNAVTGPVATDRLYYTGDGAPKMRVGSTVYGLAVPFPAGALTATLGGTGTGNITDRLYVYTFVTSFGEESEPCPISNSIAWKPGNSVTLSGFAAAPAGRGITTQRIYRSQSSVSAGTDLFFIAERAVSTANFVDAVPIDGFGEVLPSRDWNAPPSGLMGLISIANGMMVAFVGKDLYFCEPYRPHAWPESYVLTMDYPIVALGAYGTTIVVTTTGTPYLVSGQAPENMVQEKLELNLPCINARGLVDLGYAVAYPSTEGLVVVANGAANVATKSLMTRDDWLQTSPSTYVAGQYDGRYFASYEYIKVDGEPTRGTFIIDLSGEIPFLMRTSRYAEACYYDIQRSALFMLSGLGIFEWDSIGQVPGIMIWRSKQFVVPEPVNFGAILVEGAANLTPEELQAIADAKDAINAANAALFASSSVGGEINGAALNVFPINGDGLTRMIERDFSVVKVYANGKLVANVDVINKVVRLPAGFKARNWELQVEGTIQIAQISMAGTVKELNNI